MKTLIAQVDTDAEQLIPPTAPDGSRIGVHYVDAYIKPMNTKTESGIEISCKRKGLKIMLAIGDNKGEAVIRRMDHGPEVQNMLRQALETAAKEAGSEFSVEEGQIYLEA